MDPGRCLPADLWLLRGATTCTMFTSSVISKTCTNLRTTSSPQCTNRPPEANSSTDFSSKSHTYWWKSVVAKTDFEFVCPAFDPVFVSDKHFIVVQHRHKPHETPTQVALPQGVFLQTNLAVQRVCSASVLDACACYTPTCPVSHASMCVRNFHLDLV